LLDLIELPNGCICCTVKDSLVATLELLVTQKRSDLDYILIEASGMANPGPIASVFWLDDALESRLQLDGIVTLVDAFHILQQLEDTEEAAQQVAYADRLLVNKMDLLQDNPNQMERVTQALRALHPTAPMQTTTYSQVPNLDWILNANCFGGSKRLEELDTIWNQAITTEQEEQEEQPPSSSSTHNHDHSHSHNHDHGGDDDDCAICAKEPLPVVVPQHKHTAAVKTLAFQHTGSVDLSKLNQWLAQILWPNQDETDKVLTAMLKDDPISNAAHKGNKEKENKTTQQIFRIKGIVSVHYSSEEDMEDDTDKAYVAATNTNAGAGFLDRRRYIVQAVHDLWEVHPASDDLQWEEDELREGKLVLIGKYLQRDVLQQGFLSCFIT
jgi:G3E family GTPase